MANQSPGIYFKEYDNTAFENPKTTTGTVVAIVGYAKKGPIGVPVEINSWKDYKSTFGTPINEYFSGLAAFNVLSAGGSVLFTRVAEDTASPSNYIVKNPIAGFYGYQRLAIKGEISPKAPYVDSSVYCIKATSYAGNSKILYVETPSGKTLTKGEIVKQINEQLGKTASKCLVRMKKKTPSGLFSFNVELNGDSVSENPFYINCTESAGGNAIAANIQNALANGSNAFFEMTLSPAATGSGSEYLNPETSLNLSGDKNFKIIKTGSDGTDEGKKITITLADSDTLVNVVSKLNNVLNTNYSIYVLLDKGHPESEGVSLQQPKLIFIRSEVDPGINALKITSLNSTPQIEYSEETTTPENCKDLFLSSNIDSAEGVSNLPNFPATGEGFGTFTLKVYSYNVDESGHSIDDGVKNGANVYNGFTVSYDENINSIVFENSEVGEDEEKTIKPVEAVYGNYLFDETNGSANSSIELPGTDEIDLDVSLVERQVQFTSVKEIQPPTVEDILLTSYPTYFRNLSSITEQLAGEGGIEAKVAGKDSVSATARDMVVFTSKEKGSATNNISVEVYTTVSPIDESETKYLKIYENGTLKETFENISVAYNDVANRFDTKINESVDNGGSELITCDVVKKDFSDANVQLPDGVYNIGCSNNSTDRCKGSDMSYLDYSEYEYAIGTNGIPEDGDGSALFEDAMKPGTSKLANKELYDFHVLITPDDISQTVQDAAIALCEDREDAIAIIDPPQGLDKDAVIDWHNGKKIRTVALQSTYAATYWPWCKVYDGTSNPQVITWVMPSVVMAAKYVSVDKNAGCQYAPAGEKNGRLSVIDIEQYPNKLDRDDLYVEYNRVNPFVKFNDGNIYAYGEKTLQRINSVLTKIHTRRMLVQIKKTCREALKGYIFMPNTASYLGKISSNMTAILESYKSGGGISYYKVVCDETNNPVEVRQQDIINVDVIIVPEGTIEQINISLTLNKTAETVTAE